MKEETIQTTAIDYIKWRGDLTFDQSQINEVDMFLFSQLSTPEYVGFMEPDQEMTISEATEKWFSMYKDDFRTLGLLQSKHLLEAFRLMGKCSRFKKTILSTPRKKINEETMEQFEAITIIPDPDVAIVSFRGTDDTLVGWKEDCCLSVMDQVPAQKSALEYLTEVGRKYPDKILCTVGHSKGGNLAIYAAVNAPKDVKGRIDWAIGYDSPGFSKKFLESAEYKEIEARLCTVLSNNSIVGLLLNPAGRYRLVHANINGPLAHDGFNWAVQGADFVTEKELSKPSQNVHTALNETLEDLSPESKKQFIEELFKILGSSGAKTVTDLMGKGVMNTVGTILRMANDPVVRTFIRKVLKGYDRNTRRKKEARSGVPGSMKNILDDFPTVT